MDNKQICPAWAIITAVFALAAVAVTVCLILKKFNRAGCCKPMYEGFWTEDEESREPEKKDESGVRYTTEQDFVSTED